MRAGEKRLDRRDQRTLLRGEKLPSRPAPQPVATASITNFRHAIANSAALFVALEKAHVIASLRHDRKGRDYLRFSPHFYNTEAELDRAVEALKAAL